MGLGKTVQTIAYLAYLQQKQQSRKKPHIIIVPASVLDNWMAEFDKVAPQLQIVK
jgi:SNF2 family DNA or RNA helicase